MGEVVGARALARRDLVRASLIAELSRVGAIVPRRVGRFGAQQFVPSVDDVGIRRASDIGGEEDTAEEGNEQSRHR